MPGAIELRHVRAEVHGRYLVRLPVADPGGLLVGFHGFGETAEANFAELERLPGLDGWTLASIQALHPFYRRSGEIVAGWMTSQDRELAIEDNIAYVRSVLRLLRASSPAVPMAVLGFSQGTAMAYRAAAYCGEPVAAVVALGGDVPPELAELDGLPFSRVLIGRGRDDDWYLADKQAKDLEILEAQGLHPRVHEFDGGHEWTEDFRRQAGRFLLSLLEQSPR